MQTLSKKTVSFQASFLICITSLILRTGFNDVVIFLKIGSDFGDGYIRSGHNSSVFCVINIISNFTDSVGIIREYRTLVHAKSRRKTDYDRIVERGSYVSSQVSSVLVIGRVAIIVDSRA